MMPRTVVPMLALCLGLGACSDEPTQEALQTALAGSFARMSPPQMSVANLSLGGKAPGHVDDPPEVSDVHKVGCEKANKGQDGWICAFSASINGIPRPQMSAEFRKGADGALVVADR